MWVLLYGKSVYLTLVFDLRNFANSGKSSNGKTTVNACGEVYIPCRGLSYTYFLRSMCAASTYRPIHIYPMRGLSSVVRPDDLGIAKASKVGWAAGESHAFFVL